MSHEYALRLLPQQAASKASIKEALANEHGLQQNDIAHIRILKRSIDARQRTIYVNLKVRAYAGDEPVDDDFPHTNYPDVSEAPQAIVVGAGPGGLFAALRLIEQGVRPIVVERGKDVHERKKDLARMARSHVVDGESNYSFGEGGAGAYSDGKLYTRSKKRGNTEKILNVFCQHGASTDILADAHPHIGTDRLPRVIENMRKTIVQSGGEVHFQTRMTELLTTSSTTEGSVARVEGIRAVRTSHDENGRTEEIVEFRGPVILATGHSARDVYQYLSDIHVDMEAKALAVGVRLEHPAQLIDQIQYHSPQGRGSYLPAAEYSFVTQVDGRGVYSFCMCPGGFVIPAATGPEQVVVNGMSPANRGSQWSNSGMVVEVRPEDLPTEEGWERNGEDALRVMRFQERLERDCWQQAGGRQSAPAQRMADFVNGRLGATLPSSSYVPGLVASPLHFWMPPMIVGRLQQAFRKFGRMSHGFLTNQATMIGVETRTSSPVRILRHPETLQQLSLQGLFPCGEGAGYAGGIVSAAVDGERCADMCAAYIHAQ